MDRLSAMQVFATVVDKGGFSAASRALSMPLATVCRKIADLERHLGAQLLVRTTRKVTVTDSGRRFYEDVRRILDDVRDAEQQVSGEYQSPKGRLTVTAPTLFGRLLVLPIVIDFLKANSDVSLRLVLTNSVVDLLEDQVDLGIRVGALSDSSMIAVAAGSVRQIVCGTPNYLASHGRPTTPGDLRHHPCITFAMADKPVDWAFKTSSGRVQRYPVESRLILNSIEGLVVAALNECGLTQLYAYQAAHHIADGALDIVLQDHEINPVPVSLVYPQGRRVPQKLRAFVDFTLPRLSDRLSHIAAQCAGA
ncbi:MAG: LysR family transcriptional regulator [Pseudomonadota bacterium]